MTIQLNTDKNLDLQESYAEKLNEVLSHGLNRFSEYVTRLEVHLSDENADKKTKEDKKCLIEARPKGKQPIAVSAWGNTYDQAVNEAISKMKSSLDHMVGKMQG